MTTINANGDTIPTYYIFKNVRVRRNYLVFCEHGTTFGIQKKSWVDIYQFSKWMDHFIRILREKGNLSITQRHLLVLDGHKAHVTLEVVEKAKANGIDMLILSSHISHGLQPLDVSCFKPFKVAFRAYKSTWYLKNHGVKVRKEDLATWISLALEKALTSNNIKAGFKGIGI